MNSSLSAEIIGSNEHLITKILLRIPSKSLLRFKTVSKLWRSLISSRYFSSLHTTTPTPRSISGLFLRNYSPLEFKFLSLHSTSSSSSPLTQSLDFLHHIKILQSCNGLLLCSTLPEIGQTPTYYVSNPTTKQLLTLPSPPPAAGDANAPIIISGLGLDFDPVKSCSYKVICVSYMDGIDSLHHYQMHVYESESGVWRLSGPPFLVPYDIAFDNSVYWNGAIHWISFSGNGVYFDADKDRAGKMPKLPFSYEWGKRRIRYFGESGGHLHVIEIYGQCTNHEFNVYEMEKDYSAWSIRYQVQLDGIVSAFPWVIKKHFDAGNSTYYAFNILGVVEDDDGQEEEEGSSLLLHIPGKIISYNLKKKTFKKVCELALAIANGGGTGSTKDQSLQLGWLDAYQYIATLASV